MTVSINAGVPVGLVATAATLNITVTGTVNVGYLVAFPSGAAPADTSIINWNGSFQSIANGTTVKLGFNNSLTVVARQNPTHFIVDLMGYWA